MKNLFTKPLVFSLVGLAVISTIFGFKAYNNWWIAIFSVVIILIPAVYSFIPLFKEQVQKSNFSKNRLTDVTFTDRHEDLEDIVHKLSTQEHILEIKGKNQQCGKTWLAKRLCDYINFPKDANNSDIDIKCIYNKAYYLNMDEYTEKELNEFFQREYVSSKVVLIFDHVTDLNIIISKQLFYHFQLVYILKHSEQKSYQFHIISDFDSENINELQKKIKKNYPEISSLSKEEINVLYQLTNGNIGKIHSLLCEQKCIHWIKNIASNQQTEYDMKLNEIQTTLYIGKYDDAKRELEKFDAEYNNRFDTNNDLNYKYTMMLSDCQHLLNNYEDALSILSTLENERYRTNNKDFEIELHKAHYFKHLWKCNEALEILYDLKYQSYSATVDSLGILLAKYFVDDLYVPMSNNNSLNEFMDNFMYAKNSTLPHNEEDKLKINRCEAIYLYYKTHPVAPNILLDKINSVISIYSAQNNRLLANAYFICGEIYRIYSDYEKASIEYKKCLSVTHDNNIIIQTQLMIYYLKNCKKIDLKFELLGFKELTDLCAKNNYAEKLFQRIKCIEINDPNSNNIRKCFDSRFMPIL